MRSIYVSRTRHTESPLFNRACVRAKVEDVTLRDIRAKAATDAQKQGYGDAQLQVALAHTDAATTREWRR